MDVPLEPDDLGAEDSPHRWIRWSFVSITFVIIAYLGLAIIGSAVHEYFPAVESTTVMGVLGSGIVLGAGIRNRSALWRIAGDRP